MPYSGPQDKSLPEHVKKMPGRMRRQWVHIWMNAWQRCQREQQGDCEARAFKQANAVTKTK